jgi:hypothetical protein
MSYELIVRCAEGVRFTGKRFCRIMICRIMGALLGSFKAGIFKRDTDLLQI